ncbi:MAG: site-2 protease family protein [Oscillospiraceae bacterium]|nr:site-2 protease family protein [Oscillospiraceae bacterium]
MGILNRITSLFEGLNWLIIPAAFLAIVFHEISHGYVAYLLGDKTAKNSGRLSLNPIEHLDWLGLICMVFFGFGWAKPVPVNPYHFKKKKLGMVLVAIAGPLSNVIMAAISIVFAMLSARIEPTSDFLMNLQELLVTFFWLLAQLNVSLAVFNCVPIPPLDGSKVVFSFLPKKLYASVLRYEQYGMLLLIVLVNVPQFMDILSTLMTKMLWWLLELFSFILI